MVLKPHMQHMLATYFELFEVVTCIEGNFGRYSGSQTPDTQFSGKLEAEISGFQRQFKELSYNHLKAVHKIHLDCLEGENRVMFEDSLTQELKTVNLSIQNLRVASQEDREFQKAVSRMRRLIDVIYPNQGSQSQQEFTSPPRTCFKGQKNSPLFKCQKEENFSDFNEPLREEGEDFQEGEWTTLSIRHETVVETSNEKNCDRGGFRPERRVPGFVKRFEEEAQRRESPIKHIGMASPERRDEAYNRSKDRQQYRYQPSHGQLSTFTEEKQEGPIDSISRDLSDQFKDEPEDNSYAIHIGDAEERSNTTIHEEPEVQELQELPILEQNELVVERIGDFRVTKSFVTPHSNGTIIMHLTHQHSLQRS